MIPLHDKYSGQILNFPPYETVASFSKNLNKETDTSILHTLSLSSTILIKYTTYNRPPLLVLSYFETARNTPIHLCKTVSTASRRLNRAPSH